MANRPGAICSKLLNHKRFVRSDDSVGEGSQSPGILFAKILAIRVNGKEGGQWPGGGDNSRGGEDGSG
jgi:hypothetical protein